MRKAKRRFIAKRAAASPAVDRAPARGGRGVGRPTFGASTLAVMSEMRRLYGR